MTAMEYAASIEAGLLATALREKRDSEKRANDAFVAVQASIELKK